MGDLASRGLLQLAKCVRPAREDTESKRRRELLKNRENIETY